jgi:peroxiredoxin
MDTVKPGQIAPSFRLPDAEGREISLSQYKQFHPLVLLLWSGADGGWLEEFAAHCSDYQSAGANLLAIGPGHPSTTGLPFRALQDPDGQATRRLADTLPAVLVLDQFGELFQRWQGREAQAPDHADIRSWVDFTQVQCEECGIMAPHWKSA